MEKQLILSQFILHIAARTHKASILLLSESFFVITFAKVFDDRQG